MSGEKDLQAGEKEGERGGLACNDPHPPHFRPTEVDDVPLRLRECTWLEPVHLGHGMVVLRIEVSVAP